MERGWRGGGVLTANTFIKSKRTIFLACRPVVDFHIKNNNK